ncbi:hypothetical protein Nepgr_000045 [Nepenthes gracilis]|uniref:6,7-dimethyl-8-ribityllumazine synthase n=1 Tax=Nepenthes gracilis TaxID=150966 RepID=A0AAD3RW46_NEPGR|nr:hypothetical protein Nepgr_000045 [Nepenthes gracilis]
MGNSILCCLACILPCGALDLIRIVHINGCVEEFTRPVTAGEILKANPNHVLSKPSCQGVVRRILILSPESELKRGSIYFLIPVSSLLENKRSHGPSSDRSRNSSKEIDGKLDAKKQSFDEYLSNVTMPQKKSRWSRRDRRRGQVSSWRPHLESISED